ncbi:MAG: hypothetical protein H0Z35_07400 [Thermoanaerobacteraceae bacterium]|nr:hypothetical protein [Thermoanaerobacteraceae bacterium]
MKVSGNAGINYHNWHKIFTQLRIFVYCPEGVATVKIDIIRKVKLATKESEVE